MKAGDTVTVRSTGRRARIVEERGGGYYAIEYLPDQASDPMDRASPCRETRRECTGRATSNSRSRWRTA